MFYINTYDTTVNIIENKNIFREYYDNRYRYFNILLFLI